MIANVYLLIGAQGSGKSTWVRCEGSAEHSVFFDAILVKRSERAEVLSRIKPHGVATVAVWLQTPLTVCLDRNSKRPVDELVSEQALRNVYASLEPPTLSEGFQSILEVPFCQTATAPML
ncbi:AAA family ATPase [Acidovorax sp. NPDC077664]|uniref:AAA family ATPase n=1 Tax=Acidovorax sp. NPDC077664 TaxID=3390544 RepID=UPI003D03340A